MPPCFVHAGCEIPAHVGDPGEEYEAGRRRSAYLLLPWRALLSVRGRDAVAFLQGMLTQDVSGMIPQDVRSACQVERKGHLIADLWVRRLADGALLEGQSDRLEIVRETLARYVILEDVRLEPMKEKRIILVCGPHAGAVVGRAGFDGWPVNETGGSDFHVVVELEHEGDAGRRLRAAGAAPIGGRTLDRLRIEAGRPWFGRDMDERHFPMEMNLEDAVSYAKGCYIGQETIARIRYKGHVNRGLYGLRIPGPPPPEASEIRGGPTEDLLGALSSVAGAPGGGRGESLGLCLLPAAHRVAGETVRVAGRDATLEPLPFPEARHD